LIDEQQCRRILKVLQLKGFQCQPTETFDEDLLKFKHHENYSKIIETSEAYDYQFGPAGYFLKVHERGKGRIGFVSLVSKREVTCWISANYMPLWRGTPTDCFDFGTHDLTGKLKAFICIWNVCDESEFEQLVDEITEVLEKEGVSFVVESDCSGF